MAHVIFLTNQRDCYESLICFQPIREIVDKVRQASGKSRPILFHTDAAQCFGKIHVNVDDLAVDYMTIVGHKVNNVLCILIGYLYAVAA